MIFYLYVLFGSICLAEWIELPQIKPNSKDLDVNDAFVQIVDTSLEVQPQKSKLKDVFGSISQPTTQIISPLHVKKKNFTSERKKIEKEEVKTRETPENNFSKGYSAFLTLLKTVQNNLLKNAHKSTKSKLQVLTALRDNLLVNIDERIRQLWPLDENKQARGYEESTHVDFPSNEGALITIGFLTLAVFLVKLVLQVINVINAKKQYLNSTGITTTIMFGRRKRAIEDVNTFKVLEFIDNYEYGP